MISRKALSIAVIVVWLMVMIYLTYYSINVFNVLTYDETQLMPSNIEPVTVSNLVNKYIGASNETTLVVVVKLSSNGTVSIRNRLNYVNRVIREVDAPNISVTSLLTAYNDVYMIYNETISNATNEIISNETKDIWELYWSLNNKCSLIIHLNREYYSTVYDISNEMGGKLNATINYAQLLYYEIENYYLRNYPNTSLNTLFELTTREYELKYGYYGKYINELANETLSQLISVIGDDPSPYVLITRNITGILLTNYERIIQEEYPGININNVTGYVYNQLINDGINESTLKIAILIGPSTNLNLLRFLLIQEYLNDTSPILMPYIYQLACNNNTSIVYSIINELRYSIMNALMQEYPPPSILNLPNNLTQRFLNGTYTVVFIILPGNYEDEVYDLLTHKNWIYPVSTGVILYELEKMVTSDVNIIDKSTAILVFATMTTMLGTLIGPVISLTILGLTYLASLGLLHNWAIQFKLYYLTVYMIAPIIFGIGVDYSMLMLSRYLEERIKGYSKDGALSIVLSRVRPTVLTSASVVGLGLGSFAISRYGYIQDIGIGFIIAVALTIMATAIILPEIMRLLGDSVLWPMGLRAKSIELRTAFLSRMAKLAVNKPKTILSIFLVVTILALTYLLLNINITTDPVQVMPNTPAKTGLSILINYFRNYDYSTAYLVVYGNKTAALALLNETRNQSYVINAALSYNGSNLYIITATVNQQSLSDKLIPIYISLKSIANEVSREYGVKVLVGGSPSYKYYFVLGFEREYYGFILYIMIIINVVILTIYMRSVMIPLRLVATVLMSITWSLALTIFVFQGLMGIKTYWLLPVILISLLLSVGTDYDLFIISRFREEVINGYNDKDAIVRAVEFTGPVVTGAALVLAMAFASLALSSIYILKQVALAVASSVIIDSFVVRPLLVPAIIVLLGRWNWWPFIRKNQSTIPL
ncbi:acriflavin resistance family protein drug exporter [Vulcanisaeta moutnovskia 768-28]|uniref:Acriflavin resistance family protein drug exporter n=1 Tax=Vulcanisaeta moutnovskia (strain 768-28) TaxID=985053 RepID=F0QYS1_VULM7|nr:MMPL family transporter [Vulcanisaeta moutnovskia]ADY01504.1 acriflavin resistance family protein drug exporter [Vulcanisaeta moutnovskia 768-28]